MSQVSTQLDWIGVPLEESNSGLAVKYNTLLLNYENFAEGEDSRFWDAQRLLDARYIYEEHPHKKNLANGLEVEPHITLLYGLENESDFEPIKKILAECAPIKFEIGRISAFRNEDKPYDVMVVEILSKDLQDLHWKIRNEFAVTNDFPKYKPHMTLGYVQKGSCSEIEGESFWTGAQYSCPMVHFSNTSGEQIPIHLSPIVSEARTKNLKIDGKEIEAILMAGGSGFKIYSHDGKAILSLGRKHHVFSDSDPQMKTIMAYVNLRYQPASSQEMIKNNFMELISSLKATDESFESLNCLSDIKNKKEKINETQPLKPKKVLGESVGSDVFECFEICLFESNIKKAVGKKS